MGPVSHVSVFKNVQYHVFHSPLACVYVTALLTGALADPFSAINGRQLTFVVLQCSFKHTQVYKPLIILSVSRLKGL